MKLTRLQAEGVIRVLKDVLINNRYTDKSLERLFKDSPKITPADRAFIAETSYDIIRYYRMLEEVGESRSLWKLLGAWAMLKGFELDSWKEFSTVSGEKILDRYKSHSTERKIRESIPDWLDELGHRELGNSWEDELQALNSTPQSFLRVNTLKTSLQELQVTLGNEGIETKQLDGYPETLVLTEHKSIFHTKAFQDGLFEVQDAGSQRIAPFVKVTPGMRVIDACAGTGGKALHLAAHMQNKGRLIAMDIAPWKLEDLKKRARRAGVHNFETRIIDSQKIIKRFADTADRVLLDVPCSGLGVLKRNPDAKWKLNPGHISKLVETQRHILASYPVMVKPGGYLVYSTCSILPSENENQVKEFLNGNGKFMLEEEQILYPSDGTDGFYMARLKRLS